MPALLGLVFFLNVFAEGMFIIVSSLVVGLALGLS